MPFHTAFVAPIALILMTVLSGCARANVAPSAAPTPQPAVAPIHLQISVPQGWEQRGSLVSQPGNGIQQLTFSCSNNQTDANQSLVYRSVLELGGVRGPAGYARRFTDQDSFLVSIRLTTLAMPGTDLLNFEEETGDLATQTLYGYRYQAHYQYQGAPNRWYYGHLFQGYAPIQDGDLEITGRVDVFNPNGKDFSDPTAGGMVNDLVEQLEQVVRSIRIE